MPKVCVLIDRPSFSAASEGRLMTGFDQHLLYDKAQRAGLNAADLTVMQLSEHRGQAFDCTVTMGEQPLQALTGRKSVWKWHLSPLDSLHGHRILPTFSFDQIRKDWALGLYLEMTLRKAAKHGGPGPWPRKQERYIIGPDPEESIARLEAILARPTLEWLSLDIETGRNQINTMGIATSPNDAIAIKVLPGGMPPCVFHKLWSLIAAVCDSEVPKVMQNGLYERMYLSRYGIAVRGFKHDTMIAQKFLWPELEKGLDNVGRIYTMEPYWKDDGHVASEEGKRKDWGDIRDWSRHFTYNCRDTSNTLIAMHAQRSDLTGRGLLDLYDNYITKLFDPVYEMGARGLPLNTAKQKLLIAEYEARSAALCADLSQPINPRSAKAKQKLLKDKGYVLPVKRKTGKESADELSLKKLRLKHPDDTDLRALLAVAGIEKALGSYFRVRTLPDDRIRFMLDAHGTETGRFSCSKDPWDGGFNAQTLTADVKQMIEWSPESGRTFVEIDLSQAETRFVAFDANETTLLGMLERKEDVHRFVAAEIFQKAMCDVTHEERQLGKKSGHGANYNMGVTTFQESCLKELDLVLDRKMAARVLAAYHTLFSEIHKWHARIRDQVCRDRRLTNPLGRVRYFYGRQDDNTYREAYAYRPQSTVPDVVNHLMLGLREAFPDVWLTLQCHDSVTLSCAPDRVADVARFAGDRERWHPRIALPAGDLWIPVEVKVGTCLGRMQKCS